MGLAPTELLEETDPRADAARDYRSAFADFARKAREARALMASANPDRQAIDAALLQLEKAHITYNHSRDILAQLLLGFSHRPEPHLVQSPANRVREIAELRWELAGRPEGTSEDDWYRAEEIVRLAEAA